MPLKCTLTSKWLKWSILRSVNFTTISENSASFIFILERTAFYVESPVYHAAGTKAYPVTLRGPTAGRGHGRAAG